MHLQSIRLRDWKAYRQARFDFPAPDNGRNIILVGAPNGYGKTSLFEALTLGLFGREGLPLVPRATLRAEGDTEAKLATSYSKFLADALHRRAVGEGRQSCAAELEFDDDGEPIVLERRWHFSSNGQHKAYDDELLVTEGIGRRPIGPPAAVSDRATWFRDYTAQTFLPPHLAAFFLFDGEQVQRFARRDMADQVRRGIEGLLGLPALRSLQESLRKNATNRRAQVATPSDNVVRTVQSEIDQLEADIASHRKTIDEVNALLPRLLDERDHLSTELAAFGGGSVALVEELLRDEERLRSEADRLVDKLMALLAGDVAFALSGGALRQATVSRLRAEVLRQAWEAGRNQGRANLDRFLAHLDERLKVVDPALTAHQRESVGESARAAWEALWHPPPEGCADAYLHEALDGTTRGQAIARLETAGRRSAGELQDLLRLLRDANEGAEAKKRERLSIEFVAPEADAKRKRLEKASEEIGRLKEEKRTAERALEAAEGQLAAKSAELGRYTDRIGRGETPLRRAKRAEEIAAMIDDLLTEAVPTQVSEVAEAMTRAWHAMARKKDFVHRIEITPECEVRLLNRRGEDLREMQLSAGEEQIFTLALIHAIAEVSNRDFPFVVDTPLARLDEEHRLGVLRHFTERAGQVILLSTDTEVVGPYLDAIRQRVIAAYRLSVSNQDGITVTSVHEGYFERI
jgi:DNA sulfur modification protein DndD